MSSEMTEPGSRYLDGDYLAANPGWHEEDAPWKARQIELILDRTGIAPRDFCEIGCGSGACTELVKAMLPASDGTGFEISPQAFAICSRRAAPGLNFVNGSPFGKPHVYDLAIELDVIEHVDDPLKFIRDMARISRHQLFHIPLDMNALAVARDWPIADARREIGHIHYFSRTTALEMLRECGLTVLHEQYGPWALDQGGKTWKRRLAAVPRRLAFSLNPHAAVRMIGGWSLMVMTRAPATAAVDR